MEPRTELPESNIDDKKPEEAESVLLERCLEEGVEATQGEPSGLAVLEDTDHRIQVAVHAGDRYTRAVEAAAVRVDIDAGTDASAARITEVREADFAEGTSAKAEALDLVQKLAKQHGARSLVFERSRDQWEKLRLRERQTLFRELRDEGFTIRYATEANEEIRWRTLEPDAAADGLKDVQDIVCIEAEKDLAVERPQQDLLAARGDFLRAELIRAIEGDQTPERLHLPPEVSAAMEEMWEKSIIEEPDAADPVREYAGLVVNNERGEIVISQVIRGERNGVERLPVAGEGETCIGHVHTHPYESGLTDMSFSGEDFATLMRRDTDIISVVRSGDSVFGLVKSDSTPVISSDEAWQEVADEINDDFINKKNKAAEARPTGRPTFSDLQKAAVEAGKSAAKRYRLYMYYGRAGEPMRRIS